MESGTRFHPAEGLKAAAPVMAGYVPAAIAFGVAARQAGLSVVETVFMSLIVYSGASQFALAGLLAAGASWAVMAVTALSLRLRHVLYGPALAGHLRGLRAWRSALVAFGLTDEVFAVASVKLSREWGVFGWLLVMEVGVYASWAAGTWIGASAGDAVLEEVPSLAPALSFALPALFVALLVSMLSAEGRGGKDVVIAVVVAGVVAATLHLAGMGSWGVLAAGIAGPVVGILVRRRG